MKRTALMTLLLAVPLALSACSSGPSVQTSFAPLDYSYLPPITLKVANVSVRDEYLPGPQSASLIAMAPEAPASVLEHMAHERLVANGSPGSAVFVIKRAALQRVGDMLEGTMDVELRVRTSGGQPVGYAQAQVTHSITAPSNETPDRMRAALYALTKAMMSNMNVELQYQIQKGLPDWLAYAPGGGFGTKSGSAPPPYSATSRIQSQPLSGPESGTSQPTRLPGLHQ